MDPCGNSMTNHNHTHRYVFLDGLRMAAALVVVILHTSQMLPLHLALPHAALAVDFFFCLSGFVIASAYEHRLVQGLNVSAFLRMRMIRLYPMFLAAMLGGGALLILRSWITEIMPVTKAIILAISGIIFIPAGLFYNMQIFPSDNPAWSIFFELIANTIYASFSVRISSKRLLVFLAVNCIGLIWAASENRGILRLGFNDFFSYASGVFRVNLSFFIGVLVYRYRTSFQKFSHHRMMSLILFFMLSLILLFPINSYSMGFNAFAITCIFPSIVGIGSGCMPTERYRSISLTAGALSYPLYLIHLPLLTVFWLFFVHFGNGGGISPIVWAGTFVVTALISSYIVLVFYEMPVRRWLRGRARTNQTRVMSNFG